MAITRADMLKELLPGLNALFGLEYSKHHADYEEERLKDTEFVEKEVYLRVIRDYEVQMREQEARHTEVMKEAGKKHFRNGMAYAANHAEQMANEIGTSNLIHAVALQLHALTPPDDNV